MAMTTTNEAKSGKIFSLWLAFVKDRLDDLGIGLEDAKSWYEFGSAFSEGMSPIDAAVDCYNALCE